MRYLIKIANTVKKLTINTKLWKIQHKFYILMKLKKSTHCTVTNSYITNTYIHCN